MNRLLPWSLLAIALVLPVVLAVAKRGQDPFSARKGPDPFSDYGMVPEFQLVEQSGETVRSADLRGRPWVADFIYTRCEGSCPGLSAAMARLRPKLPAGVPLVSFSVDPVHDTPGVLSGYADRFHAAPGSWLFLTGDAEAMRELVSEGFHLAMVGGADASPITHSDKIVLVDERLRIRRYYDGTEDGWIESLLRDLERLPG